MTLSKSYIYQIFASFTVVVAQVIVAFGQCKVSVMASAVIHAQPGPKGNSNSSPGNSLRYFESSWIDELVPLKD